MSGTGVRLGLHLSAEEHPPGTAAGGGLSVPLLTAETTQVVHLSGLLRLENKTGDEGGRGEGAYWRFETWIKKMESRAGFLIGANGAIYAIRKHLYTPIPKGLINDDFFISMKVLEQGWQVKLEPLVSDVSMGRVTYGEVLAGEADEDELVPPVDVEALDIAHERGDRRRAVVERDDEAEGRAHAAWIIGNA